MGNTKLFYFEGTLRPEANLDHDELADELRTGRFVIEQLRVGDEPRVIGAVDCSSLIDPTWALVKRLGPLTVVRADLDWTDVHVLEFDRDGALMADRVYEVKADFTREHLCCLCTGAKPAWGCRCSCHERER